MAMINMVIADLAIARLRKLIDTDVTIMEIVL
jgi:hypothetical protein